MCEKSTWDLLVARRLKQISEMIDLERQLDKIKRTTLDLKEKSESLLQDK